MYIYIYICVRGGRREKGGLTGRSAEPRAPPRHEVPASLARSLLVCHCLALFSEMLI